MNYRASTFEKVGHLPNNSYRVGRQPADSKTAVVRFST